MMRSGICKKNIVFIVVSMFVAMFLISMWSHAVDEIKNINNAPDPVNVDGANITINATVKYTAAGSGGNVTTLVIEYPVSEEVIMSYVRDISSDEKRYTVSYNPNQTGEYSYRIRAEEDAAATRESGIYTFDSAYFPFIKSVSDSPDPVKYDTGSVTFQADIYYWNYSLDTVILEIVDPVFINITMTNVSALEEGYVFEASYDPENVSTYNYTIFANDTSGAFSYSSYYTFNSEGYPPQINSVSHVPGIVLPGDHVFFTANVTDARDDLDTVLLNIVSPVSESIKMVNISADIFVASYTTPLDPRGMFYYFIWANDTEGFVTTSDYRAFISNELLWDNATISVKISPSCCGMFSFFYIPERVIQNQTLVLLSIFENCGNVGINETTNITVEKDVINEYGMINESNLVIIPPNIIRYWQGSMEYVEPLHDDAFFSIFYTTGLPLGNYTANTSAFYFTNTSIENETFECSGVVSLSRHFEIVEETGEGEISPVVIIREMPPQINQDTVNCNSNSTWNGSCTYTSVKLIVYNKGAEAVNSLVLSDLATKVCGGGNCSPLAYRCVNNSDSYSCYTVVDNLSEIHPNAASYVYFHLNGDLKPREYAILEYELMPTNNAMFYDTAQSNGYNFAARADYYYGAANESRTAQEDHEVYNPPLSNVLYLINKSSFNYGLDVDTDTSNEQRGFEVDRKVTFYVKAVSISGSDVVKRPWHARITLPFSWNVTSCAYVSGPSCSCSYNNTEKWVMCNGSSDVSNMEVSEFSFTANTQIQSDFLLSIYSNDSNTDRYMDESYIPGLFALSRAVIEEEVPEPTPEPEPTPTPRPEPEPIPVTEPEPEPIIEIVLTPLNSSYKAFQGQMIPTIYKVENIGETYVENISIEPVLLPGWNYSETLIDFLNVSEYVNRTMFITPPEDAVPGMYAIPIRAIVNNETADIAYIWIEVLRIQDYPKIRIVEAPEIVEFEELSNVTIPILVENIGKKVLHNVSARIENAEQCLNGVRAGEFDLNISEIKPIDFQATTTRGPRMCRANLIVYSAEDAYAFAPVKIIIKAKPPLIPIHKRITPWLALLWTIIFVIYAITRKRKARMGEIATSNRPRMILYMLLFGELVILAYVFMWYFGVIEII